jgi:hypothetical protein
VRPSQQRKLKKSKDRMSNFELYKKKKEVIKENFLSW